MPQYGHSTIAGILTASLAFVAFGLGHRPGPRSELQSGGSTADQIVSQFFPQALVNGPEVKPGSWVAQTRKSAFVVLETQPDGRPGTLVAGYTNGIRGAIRLIRAQADGSYQVSYEPSSLDLGGLNVFAELQDLDGDSRPEAVISFSTFRNQTVEWIFRWTGTTLENLTPMLPEELGTSNSRLVLSKFVDLDHDGKLEILTEENYPPQNDANGFALGGSLVFRLGTGGYMADKPLPFWGFYVRRTGPPQVETRDFSLSASSLGPYTLKLVNGDANGSNRVSYLRIKLNGTEILSPNQFSQQVQFLNLAANLTQANTIEVTLDQTPPGHTWLTIQDEGVGTPRIVGTVMNKGHDTQNNYFVDVQFSNTGNGHARALQIGTIVLRRLSGTGEVTLNTSLSPALPHAVGDLDAGASITRRFYLNLPSTVTRFSITESGSLTNLLGTSANYSAGQSVIP